MNAYTAAAAGARALIYISSDIRRRTNVNAAAAAVPTRFYIARVYVSMQKPHRDTVFRPIAITRRRALAPPRLESPRCCVYSRSSPREINFSLRYTRMR